MKMKNMVATMTAVALSAFSFAAMTASAAVTEIPYNGASEGALAIQDDGISLRKNIFNEWGHNVKDVNNKVVVTDNITVTFTVSGLGTNSCNKNKDGTDGEAYYAYIAGSVSGTNVINVNENGNAPVAITGDGQYTATWDLPVDAAESFELLLIGTNIDIYQYGYQKDQPVSTCGLDITIDSIKTGVEDAPTEVPTDAPTEAPTTEAPATTTTAAATTTGAAATTAAGTTTTKANTTTGNAATGDATPIAVALAGLTVAGAVALVSRKRK